MIQPSTVLVSRKARSDDHLWLHQPHLHSLNVFGEYPGLDFALSPRTLVQVRLFVMVVPLGDYLGEKNATSSPSPLVVIQRLHSPEFSLLYLSPEGSIDEASTQPVCPEAGKYERRTCVVDAAALGDQYNSESRSKSFRAGRRGRTLHAATERGAGKCENQGRDEVSANNEPSVTLGPFWSGPLIHRGFVSVVIREVHLSVEAEGNDGGQSGQRSALDGRPR